MTSILGPRNLGGILSETFKIYRKNFVRLLAIVAIVQVTMSILDIYVLRSAIMTQGKIEPMTPSIPTGIIFLWCVIMVPLMGGALIHAVSEQYLRQKIGIGRAYRFAWGRLGTLTGASMLAILAIVGLQVIPFGIGAGIGAITFREAGNILKIILMPVALCAGIYLMVRWTFIWPVALVEGVGTIGALSRSSDLVRGNWWRVVGIMLVVTIISGVIGFLLAKILGLIPIVGPIMGRILSTPIAIIGATLLYYDLRVRKEGYSLDTLSEELQVKINSDVVTSTKLNHP